MYEPVDMGLFASADDALETLQLRNRESEESASHFSHLVLERVSFGLYAKPGVVVWYAITRDEFGLVQSNPCDEPSWFGMSRFGRK